LVPAGAEELGKGETSMKLRALLGLVLVSAISWTSTGCSRNAIEAINLANEADKQRNVDVDGAISKYEQAITLDPTNHRILFKLAMAYRKKEAWEKVASTLARATQVAPKFANYWYERGYAIEEQALKKAISWEEAKEPFKKCIENDPNYADCYHELGLANLWTDNEQEALSNYTKAIEHNPAELRYYASLSDLYINLGYYDQAQQVLKEGLTYAKDGDKSLFGLHVLLSQVFQKKKQMTDMVGELEAARKVAGDEHPEILFNLGSTYAVLTPPRTTEAIQLLKAFSVRACRGAGATTKYKDQCETSQSLVAKLGGSMQ
jgi:tetratricopeptide (TPR) repeat protein